MPLEFGLVENALDSLREAMNYFNEGDEDKNATQYKFSILLAAHSAELLLKEILRRNHASLLFENIDRVTDLNNGENITVGYKTSITRVKNLCGVNLLQYESYLEELGRIRNKIQHYKYSINGEYHKQLMSKAFSAIEFLFMDVLNLKYEDFEDILDKRDVDFLHEDIAVFDSRMKDIQKEFQNGSSTKFEIEYSIGKFLSVRCPNCGAKALSTSDKIKCKMCGTEFADYIELHQQDRNCISSSDILRELGRRIERLDSRVFDCPECEEHAVVHISGDKWHCLVCGLEIDGSVSCDECGNEMPNYHCIYSTAISDIDTEDYKFLCPDCTKKYNEQEEYIGYEIS